MNPPPHVTTARPEDLLKHMGFVRTLAHALVSDPEVAEDVAQEAMLAAIAKPPVLQHSGRSWFRGVVSKLVKFHYRSQVRRSQREDLVARDRAYSERTENPRIEDVLFKAEQKKLVVQAVMDLREPYRTAVLLRYMEELPPRRIAELQGISVHTVQTHLQRGLAQLRERMDRDAGGDRRVWMSALGAAFLQPTAPPPLSLAGLSAVKVACSLGVLLAGSWLVARGLGAFGSEAPARTSLEEVARSEAAPSSPGAPRVTGEDERLPDHAVESAREVAALDRSLAATGRIVTVLDEAGGPIEGAALVAFETPEVAITGADGRAAWGYRGDAHVRIDHPEFLPGELVLGTEQRAAEVRLVAGAERTLRLSHAETGEPLVGVAIDIELVCEYTGAPEFPEIDELDSEAAMAAVGVRAIQPFPELDAIENPAAREFVHDFWGTGIRSDANGEVRLRVPERCNLHFSTRLEPFVDQEHMLGPDDNELTLRVGARLRIARALEDRDSALWVSVESLGGMGRKRAILEPHQQVAVLSSLEPGQALVRTAPVPHELLLEDNEDLLHFRVAREGRVSVHPVTLVAGEEVALDLTGDGVELRVALTGFVPDGRKALEVRRGALVLARSFTEDSHFTVEALEPGDVELRVVRGGEVLGSTEARIPDAQRVHEVSLHLDSSSLVVEFAEGCHPSLELCGPLDGGGELERRSGVGRHTRFVGLAPGRYGLWIGSDSAAHWHEVEVLAGENELSVALDERALASLHVPLDGSYWTAVVVTDAHGRRVPLSSYDPHGIDDAEQETRHLRLPPGAYSVAVRSDSGLIWQRSVELASDVRLQAPPADCDVAVSLRFVSAGRPAGARVFALLCADDPIPEGWTELSVFAADGVLETRLAPGEYVARIADGHELRFTVDADGGTIDLDSSN